MTEQSNKIKVLANQLLEELQKSDEPDQEALALIKDLNCDLQSVVARNQDSNEITDLLTNLESRFAVDHPVAERFIRDIIDTLGKIGI